MKKFTKNVEDFVCEHCGCKVIGNGFSNHCPSCFYSKHVDINPGDRMCTCKGIMKPVNFVEKSGVMHVVHQCEKCGIEKKNKLSDEDSKENMYIIMKNLADFGKKNILENNKFAKLSKNKIFGKK